MKTKGKKTEETCKHSESENATEEEIMEIKADPIRPAELEQDKEEDEEEEEDKEEK